MSKLVYKVTSEQPCQVNVLGEFAAGETKTITDELVLQRFERIHRHKLGASRFPFWFKLEVLSKGEPSEEPVEDSSDEDESEEPGVKQSEDKEETEEA